jgi:hypothetical protein
LRQKIKIQKKMKKHLAFFWDLEYLLTMNTTTTTNNENNHIMKSSNMQYDFNTCIGIKNFENPLKLYDLMIDFLHLTKVQVSFHILPKKERHFLCPIACISESDGKLIVEKVSAFSREPFHFPLDKNKMVQVIKKALKNQMRIRTATR